MGEVLDLQRESSDVFGLSNYCQEAIEQELKNPSIEGKLVPELYAAYRYMALSGGKRIRPLLAMLLCHDLGGDPKRLLPAAVTIELIHTASLIHDDLPALDNDDLRRGQPTCHKAFDEPTAVLAGDAIVSLAIELLSAAPYPPEQRIMFIRALSGSFTKLCNGQQLDVHPQNRSTDLSTIYRLKTGALFAVSAEFAGIEAGLGKVGLDVVRELGLWIGTYFQVVDDFIDVFGSERERGRKGSSDRRNRKETYFSTASKGRAGDEALTDALQKIEHCLKLLGNQLGTNGSSRFKGTRHIIERIRARMAR